MELCAGAEGVEVLPSPAGAAAGICSLTEVVGDADVGVGVAGGVAAGVAGEAVCSELGAAVVVPAAVAGATAAGA